MNETSPLAVILVQNGSKGDKLLYLYPYDQKSLKETVHVEKRHSHYATTSKDDLQASNSVVSSSSNIEGGQLVGFSEKVLSNLFAVKTQLCGKKFELKVNDVRFVGHPTSLQASTNSVSPKWHISSILLFNIIFALRANASHSVVNCYHDLSQRLGAALRHEERRCGYLSREAKIMLSSHDESTERGAASFEEILPQSVLAQEIKAVYESLCSTGLVHLFLNNWVEVSFCLPQRIHSLVHKNVVIEPENLQKCFAALRPYHAMLLLVDEKELRASLDQDASPALDRLIRVTSPLKSLQQLSADADLPLGHIFDLVNHLVYWAKATIIYPLCETNVYVLSPHSPTHITSSLVEKFTEKFPGSSLLAVMSDFSFPTALSQNPMTLPQQQVQQVQMVVWMLQHRLLMQLHTYIYLISTPEGNISNGNYTAAWNKNLRYGQSQLQQIDEVYHSVAATTGGGRDSDAGSGTSDEYGASPVYTKANGSLLTEERFASKHLHDRLPTNLSPVEKENILKVPSANNADDLHLFARLCPYFRGQHHLEEIMYIENVRRSQILALLDKFRKVLFTCQHEDKAVAMFYRYSKDL